MEFAVGICGEKLVLGVTIFFAAEFLVDDCQSMLAASVHFVRIKALATVMTAKVFHESKEVE